MTGNKDKNLLLLTCFFIAEQSDPILILKKTCHATGGGCSDLFVFKEERLQNKLILTCFPTFQCLIDLVIPVYIRNNNTVVSGANKLADMWQRSVSSIDVASINICTKCALSAPYLQMAFSSLFPPLPWHYLTPFFNLLFGDNFTAQFQTANFTFSQS